MNHRGYLDRELLDVCTFHQKFGIIVNDTPTHLTKRKLSERVECMQEELEEFKEAMKTQDMAAMADALVDLVYFVKGTAVMMGLPWRDLWDDVQRANMSKVRGVGHRGHAVDCVKPEGWVPPQTVAILRSADYRPENFTGVGGWIDEEKCCDDIQ